MNALVLLLSLLPFYSSIVRGSASNLHQSPAEMAKVSSKVILLDGRRICTLPPELIRCILEFVDSKELLPPWQ